MKKFWNWTNQTDNPKENGRTLFLNGTIADESWYDDDVTPQLFKGVASDELIDEVKNHIEENRPIGAEVTVESAEPLTIDVSVTLTLSNGASIDAAKEKITESITNYLRKNAFAISYISYAQIGGCILACDEIADYSDLKLNNDTQNISVSETQVPVLGVVTVA